MSHAMVAMHDVHYIMHNMKGPRIISKIWRNLIVLFLRHRHSITRGTLLVPVSRQMTTRFTAMSVQNVLRLLSIYCAGNWRQF